MTRSGPHNDQEDKRKRLVSLRVALFAALAILGATASLYSGLHPSAPIVGLAADAMVLLSGFLFVAGVVLVVVAMWLSRRENDQRAFWVALLAVFLFAPLAYLAAFDSAGFMGALAGVFASIMLALAASSRDDVRL